MAKRIKLISRDPVWWIGMSSVFLFTLISFFPQASSGLEIYYSNQSIGTVNTAATKGQKNYIESDSFQPQSPSLNLIGDNTISGFSLPTAVTPEVLGAIIGNSESDTSKDITEYTVASGDTLATIAQKFSISLDTLLWANNLSKWSRISAGQKLIISPVTGVIYLVKSGDTISEIAKDYKADANDIMSFNGLTSSDELFMGEILVIPNGTLPSPLISTPYLPQIPVASSYFICPISAPCQVTQGLHFYNTVDFSHGECGDYIYAAAGGVVQKIEYGWNGGNGNTIFISHPNGVVTSYGHILSALVVEGEYVYQGQRIALMGGDKSTQGLGAGVSSGCHVNFAVYGSSNPFASYTADQVVPQPN